MAKLIFILEDNTDLRELYEIILEEENYEILSFCTIAEFRQHENEVPDLYLLDVMLPDGDGVELCKEPNAHPATTNVPIIMVSAHKDIHEVKQKCPNADFVAKPFDIDHLTQTIASKITRRQA